MNTLQIQIHELQEKVDRLHDLVERISSQINALTAEQQKSMVEDYSFPPLAVSRNQIKSQQREVLNSSMSHKDILVDDSSSTPNKMSVNEQALSPDIQIRRLTAQLTAAYNRIAALEEQLLSSKIHF